MSETPSTGAVTHWVGDAPTSLHGNGAASFTHTTRDARGVTCRLCLSLLAREADRPICPECFTVRAINGECGCVG